MKVVYILENQILLKKLLLQRVSFFKSLTLRGLLFSLVFSGCLFGLGGQIAPTPTPRGDWKPVPYQEAEFDLWAQDLRRAEVLAIGAYPLSFLLASLVYDLGRWAVKAANNDSDASTYAPFSATKPALTSDETLGLFLGGLGISVSIALIDFIIGQDERAREVERQKQAQYAGVSPSASPEFPAIKDSMASSPPLPEADNSITPEASPSP